MDGISSLISIVFLLIITFIGLLKSETLLSVIGSFILLTITAYITIYMFNVN